MNAFVMLAASRVEAGPVRMAVGGLQQETRLFSGDECVCVLLVTYPNGSPEWFKWHQGRTLDSLPATRVDPVLPDAARRRALLYQHEDGRYAVATSTELATFAVGDPQWHRVGPVEIHQLGGVQA